MFNKIDKGTVEFLSSLINDVHVKSE